MESFFSVSFSQTVAAKKVRLYLAKQHIPIVSEVNDNANSKRLFFIREDRELPTAFDQKTDRVFKLPSENTSLFEVIESLEVIEIDDNLSEIMFVIEREIDLYRAELNSKERKAFEKKEIKKILNEEVEKINNWLPKQIEAISEGLKVKPPKKDEKIFFDFSAGLVREHFRNQQSKSDEQAAIENKLNEIDHGLLLKNSDQEYVWFNKAFKEFGLDPIELPILEKTENCSLSFKALDREWQIQGRQLGYEVMLLIITAVEEQQGIENNEELGIISSSIAHELNNPLGGISAALDVLMLEEEHSDSTLESLQRMKETVKRCKGLIQTFLGFSKKDIDQASAVDWDRILSQGYDLLKFRMVESNLKINYEKRNLEKFQVEANPSVMTMVLYLIFNELLTLTSHLDLIEGQETKQLDLLIIESTNKLTVQSAREIETPKLPQEKLLKHLLQIYGLDLTKMDNGFSLHFRESRL